MKYSKIAGLVVLFMLFSCTENQVVLKHNLDENLVDEEIAEKNISDISYFFIPCDNELFEQESLEDLLDFYPQIESKYGKEGSLDYLKKIAIHAIFYNGLLEEDTETILFYVKELANASLSLPNIENFNNAILELESRKIDADLLEPMVLEFSNKHKSFLEKMKDEDKKEKHENRLALLDKLQSRYN